MPQRKPNSFRTDSTPARRPGIVRRRYHARLPGVVYILVTLLVALGAFNSQNNLLFWAFGFSLAVLVVSGLISGAMLMSLDVVRLAVPDQTAAAEGELRYSVRNRAWLLPAFALRIEEMEGGGGRSRNATDHRWTDHLRVDPAFVIHVGPRQTIVVSARTRGLNRGRTHLTGVRVLSSFPFGLIGKSMEFEQRQEVVALPAAAPVRASLLSAAGRAGASGAASSRAGTGEEFHALREYIAGDPVRSIAWRATARQFERTGDLLIRQTAADIPRRLWIVLRLPVGNDASSSPAVLERAGRAVSLHEHVEALPAIERAIDLSAGLAMLASKHDYAVGLAAPLMETTIACGIGSGHVSRMLRAMGEWDIDRAQSEHRSGREPGFPAVLDSGSVGGSSGGGLVIVVHAGRIDTSFDRRAGRTLHISTDHLEQLLEQPNDQSGAPEESPHNNPTTRRRSEATAA